jgi:hypothetical protein
MYGNINTLIAFDKVLSDTQINISGGDSSSVDVSIPGLNASTDVVGFLNLVGIGNVDGEFSINPFVTNNTLTVRISAATSTIINAGTHIKGVVARCDNSFKADGL